VTQTDANPDAVPVTLLAPRTATLLHAAGEILGDGADQEWLSG
jgi:hypothetical protein